MLAQSVLTWMNGHHEGPPAHESFCPTMTHLSRTRQKTTIGTAAGQAVSEPRGLPIDAPDVAQGVADLAQRGLGAGGPAGGQRGHLLQLDLMADSQDLQLMADRLGVAVDADHLLLTLLKGNLVGECRIRDLGHEPAVLDAAQDARCQRTDRVSKMAVRAR